MLCPHRFGISATKDMVIGLRVQLKTRTEGIQQYYSSYNLLLLMQMKPIEHSVNTPEEGTKAGGGVTRGKKFRWQQKTRK